MISGALENALWGTDANVYRCRFRLEDDETGMLLTFVVDEPMIIAQKRPFNDNVHLDNCVEMFLQFYGDEGYYNVEVNCFGSLKIAYGPNRKERVFLPVSVLQRIQDDLRIAIRADAAGAHWEIAIRIGREAFCHTANAGGKARVNFTKCGGSVSDNYLSWVEIDTPQPDFHRPEFFREIFFERFV